MFNILFQNIGMKIHIWIAKWLHTNKNNSILLEVFAWVFTVSSNFTDNPRMHVFNEGYSRRIVTINTIINIHVWCQYCCNALQFELHCTLFQLQTDNMVSYTLSGFYIPRAGGSGIFNPDNVYETILPFWSWNNIFVILQILYKTPF